MKGPARVPERYKLPGGGLRLEVVAAVDAKALALVGSQRHHYPPELDDGNA